MYKNFSDVFNNIKNIPIAILLESLMKQISISGNITYHFNIFDFEFFQVIAKHPRLHLKLAIDFVDLLGKIICNDVTFSACAFESFMIILRRYHEHETMQQYMQSFTKLAMKFLINFEKQKTSLEKTHQLEGDKLKTGRGMSYIRQISNPEDQKMKWIQKTLFINFLKNVIERIGSSHINNMLKPLIIKTYLQIQKKYKTKHRGLRILIELFGDADQLIAEYKEANKNRSLERDDDVDLVSIKSHKVQNKLQKSGRGRKNSIGRTDKQMINLSVQQNSNHMSPNKMQSMRDISGYNKKDADSDMNYSVMSEMPNHSLTKNQQKLMYQPDNMTMGKYKMRNKLTKNEERAMREIEKVKMRRQRRLEDKLFEEERKQMQQEKLKKQIKAELQKRKVEHGVISTSKKRFKKKELIRETSIERDEPIRKKHLIDLYDFSLEEEKDQNDIRNFIRTYKKLLHFLFKTYANSGYSHKNVNSFDAMHNKMETMSLAEAIMMLKKNSIIPELIHKEEAATLVRLVNSHIMGDKREGKTLTFDAFNSFFLQVAMFSFGREPINLSQKPPIDSVKALLKLFEKSALQRGESIKLFENPDHTIIADNDVIKELNRVLKKNPDHPMPEGFKKIKIKEYKSEFKVPEYMPIPEKNKIALEVLDELLAKNFGFHLFEPINKPVFIYKAKPVLKQLMKYPVIKKDVPFVLRNSSLPPKGKKKSTRFMDPIPTKAYKDDRSFNKSGKRKKLNQSHTNRSNINRSMPAQRYGVSPDPDSTMQRQRVYNDVTPELGLNLRLEVVKYPMQARDHVQEVAETLEEVLNAASQGLDKLPPRKKYGLHNFLNKAQLMRQEKEDKKNQHLQKKEQQYESHRQKLQDKLKNMKEERKKISQETKPQRLEKKRKLRDQRSKTKAKTDAERERVKKEIAEKRSKEQQEKMKKEDMKRKIQEELQKRKKDDRKEFLNKRKSEMHKKFVELKKNKSIITAEEEKKSLHDKTLKKKKNEKWQKLLKDRKSGVEPKTSIQIPKNNMTVDSNNAKLASAL